MIGVSGEIKCLLIFLIKSDFPVLGASHRIAFAFTVIFIKLHNRIIKKRLESSIKCKMVPSNRISDVVCERVAITEVDE